MLPIEVRGLRRAYPGQGPAVDGLDLTVAAGEIFALLGPNGAGKTTTVEILEGYRRRDDGEVSVLGVDPAHADAAWRARIGIVPQEPDKWDELTAREIVSHFARYYPHPADPPALLDRVGLGNELAGRRVQRLSGGQRRRLDVALALVGEPELLFLDEPTTGFDPAARREFWELIRELSAAGTTILLTTHYLDEAQALADRVGVLRRGTLVALATPDELGGRASRDATVSWLSAAGPRSETTAEPTALVARLAAEYGGEVPELAVSRPSLEDVYLELIAE